MHVCVIASQVSVVQSFPSAQSVDLLHWMQPSFGSQIFAAAPQAPASGLFEHTPPLHASLVHAILSSQSVSVQHPLQPSVQHLVPAGHELSEQLPPTQVAVWQAFTGQSVSFTHWAVRKQPLIGSQADPAPQAAESGS